MSNTTTMSFINLAGEKISGYRFQNPDGTIGGWVAKTATIAKGVYIGSCAIVGPDAIVGLGAKVHTFEEIAEGEYFE